MGKRQKILIWSLVIIALVLIGGWASSLFIRYMKIAEIGQAFTKVFWTNFNVELVTQGIAIVIIFVLVLINCIIMRSNLLNIDSEFSYLKRNIPILLVSFVVALVASGFVREMVASKFLPFANSEWFNQGDPIFNQDVGYYVFQRPFMMALLSSVGGIMLFLTAFNVLGYAALYARYDIYRFKDILKEKAILIHVVISIALYFTVKACTYKFLAEDILFNAGKEFTGAGFTDIKVWLPYYNFAPYFLILVVACAIYFALKMKLKSAILAVFSYPALWVIMAIIASTVQALYVAPNELAVQAPYLSYNIELTRKAYALDKMVSKDFKVTYDLNKNDILKNTDTVDNIRLIDYDQTLKVMNQNQVIRPYYEFKQADIVTYELNGKKTAVFLSAREMNQEKLDQSAKNYINLKMKYTHGSGVVMNPVNSITEEGLPQSIIKDVPTRSIEGAPQVKQPRIYFGEGTNDYVIANTKGKELDDIDPDYTYDGQAGIQLNFLNRLIFSVIYGDFNILISDQIQDSSKILLNRNIIDRVRTAAPFLNIDQDACILIDNDGRLKWVVDGYTSTDKYPYAQKTGNYNYIRNSVKAVVDAYDGTVQFYIMDKTDPIIKAYARAYPTLFQEGELPDDIASHLRYPEQLFKVQANMLRKYHLTDTTDFYQKKGMWAISKEKYENDNNREVAPYYNLMKVDKDKNTELVLMSPFTLVGKDNMVSWLAVQCEKDGYGQLINYNFPINESIYGTAQIESNIDADANISADMTLWRQGGSTVVRGNLLVVPIESSLLYVEPVYISATGDAAIPQLKRVIVAYGQRVVMTPTLNEALKKLFDVNRQTEENDATINDIISRVVSVYDQYKSFAANGDWESMGKAQKELETAIGELQGYRNEIVNLPLTGQ